MFTLRRHHNPLKSLPPLIWVEEYEFVTQLKLEECYAKLAIANNNRAKNQLIRITEVLWDGNSVYFAAEMTRDYGRISAWAGLEGKISIHKNDKIDVHYYIGDNPSSVGVSTLLGLALLFVIVFFYHINFIVGILLSSFPFLLLINSFKKLAAEVQEELNSEMTQF
jgi:hypothetical protein